MAGVFMWKSGSLEQSIKNIRREHNEKNKKIKTNL